MRGAVVPRGGSMVCRDALPTTSYPCRPASPVTPFRVRHDKRVLDPQDAPSTETAAARAGLPRLRAGSLPAGRHAPRCLALCLPPCLSQSLLWFDPRREPSSVPTTVRPRRRAQTSSRLARRAACKVLALTRSSTVPGWRCRAVSPRRAHAETLVLSTAPSGTTPRSR